MVYKNFFYIYYYCWLLKELYNVRRVVWNLTVNGCIEVQMLNITQICEVYKAIKSGDRYCRQGLCVGYESIKKIEINSYLKQAYPNDR